MTYIPAIPKGLSPDDKFFVEQEIRKYNSYMRRILTGEEEPAVYRLVPNVGDVANLIRQYNELINKKHSSQAGPDIDKNLEKINHNLKQLAFPYSRKKIQQKAEYFGRLLELEIRGYDYESIASRIGSTPGDVAYELYKLHLTIETSEDDVEIIWDDLHLPGHFDWRPTEKYLKSISKPA